jgi:hypothetical protein
LKSGYRFVMPARKAAGNVAAARARSRFQLQAATAFLRRPKIGC